MLLPPADVLSFWPDYRSADMQAHGLAPVLKWVVDAVRPVRIVDLCAPGGDSVASFAQCASGGDDRVDLCAIVEDGIKGRTARNAQGTLTPLERELQRRADAWARVLHQSHRDAATGFAPGSIDILHIAGGHGPAVLRKLIKAWQPALAADGVVMMRGIAPAGPARAVWQEICVADQNRTFDVAHSGGLGLWCPGSRVAHDMHRLCALPPPDAAITRQALALAGERVAALTAFEARLMAQAGKVIGAEHTFARGDDLDRLRVFHDLTTRAAPLGDDAALWARLRPGIDRRVGPVMRRKIASVYDRIEPMVRQTIKHKNDVQDDAIIGIGAKVDAQDEAIHGLAAHLRRLLAHPLFR